MLLKTSTVLSFATLLTLSSGAHAAGLVATSTAAAVAADLTIGGTAYKLPYEVDATGAAPPAYDKKETAKVLSKTVALKDGLTLSADAKTLASVAMSKGVVGASIASNATSVIGSTNMTISGGAFGTVLTITSGKITSSAKYSANAVKSLSSGKVTITSLTVNAPLLGINNLTFTGTPTPNQILYQNSAKTLTVYLNAQMPLTSSGKTVGLGVEAIDFHTAGYSVAGVSISGDIGVGIALASK